MSEASRSIICRSRRLRQIIDLRDTDKSRYFAITEFNNCFIIRSPSLFSYFNHFLAAQGSNLPFFSREHGSNYACAEYYLQQTRLNVTTHEQIIICRQLFAGYVVGSQPMERKKTMRRMTMFYILYWYLDSIRCSWIAMGNITQIFPILAEGCAIHPIGNGSSNW